MLEKINNVLAENPKFSLAQVAKNLEVDYMEVLTASDKTANYPTEKMDELFDVFRSWEKVFLLVITKNFVVEIADKFPKGFKAHGYLNFHDKDSSIGGHLSVDNITSIYIVDDVMFGRRSCSIKFFDKDNSEVFGIYVPRNEKKELMEGPLKDFEKLLGL